MIYQIVSPIVATIEGDSFKEAIKNYVKFNHNLNIRNLIIKDQSNHAYEAKLRYYMQNERNKVGIDVYPYTNVSYPIIAPIPSPVIALNTPITAINTPAVVTTKNSPIIATDSNVFIRTPKFYF
jgi:hypothetical protein